MQDMNIQQVTNLNLHIYLNLETFVISWCQIAFHLCKQLP